jgi:hypothetical protein
MVSGQIASLNVSSIVDTVSHLATGEQDKEFPVYVIKLVFVLKAKARFPPQLLIPAQCVKLSKTDGIFKYDILVYEYCIVTP